MKKFTKLALAASVALSANAMAMQAMDDSTLSATTGQDGINIGIGISKITIDKLFIHDNDGLNPTLKGGNLVDENADGTANVGNPAITGSLKGTGVAGAIVIQGVTDASRAVTHTLTKASSSLPDQTFNTADHGLYIGANYSDGGAYLLASRNLADLQIDSDAGTKENGGAFINVAAQVSGLEIHIGEIGVAASATQAADSIRRGATFTQVAGKGETTGNYNAILSGLSILTGQIEANIQLGAAPQGAMIKLDTKMLGGLEIKNLGILDSSTIARDDAGVATGKRTAGEIFIESIKIADEGKKDLTISSNISVFNTDTTVGKEKEAHIRIVSNDTGATDQYIKGIRLGSRTAASIGDVEIQGLQTYYSPSASVYTKGAVITISGH
ncbi:pilus assembly protein FilA [Acinetobacter wanghuae]|uniref:Pilus assembly protein FilA n=1 Tax=Acinetobacter wanghuae TaxID=2662362 RepID=A0A5Q0P0U7_9GAMM|nr:DUF6160 family protein [Acinetobacter wanghuae]MQW93191.1 pilus assembly protein FilA [Acinetobacter wanghuae]QGA10384.1 pilus assembly protein FilA [Acinetobacter wanghuae]